ncbi:MAG: glycosyltransferase [Bacteroidota bacterium]
MAHIFKHPEGTQKGIIVFTHKEIKAFVKFKKSTRFNALNRIQDIIFPFSELQSAYKSSFDRIRKNYFVGLHFGWRHENFPTLPFIDFYMGGEGTVTFQEPEQVLRIPFNSRAFSPVIFQPDPSQPKNYDLICVSRNARFKHLDRYLASVRKMYDLNKKYRVLLVVPSVKNENPKSHYVELEDDYNSMFSLPERELFTLLKLDARLGIMGLSQVEIARLYQQSKVFSLFSQLEGESRVISEALLCGLRVVVKDDLQGGGKDLLNSNNSVEFTSYEDAHLAWIKAIEGEYEPELESLAKLTREDYTIPKLRKYFHQLYERHGQQFDDHLIHTDRLAMRLPAHDLEQPWAQGRFKTADILEAKQFELFLNSLKIN